MAFSLQKQFIKIKTCSREKNMFRCIISSLPQKYVHTIGWTLGAQGLLVLMRILRFIILARLLGVEQFGLFTAATALAAFASPFAGWGFESLLTRNIARDHAGTSLWWGNGLLVLLITAAPMSLLLSMFGPILLPGSTIGILLPIVAVDLFSFRIINMAEGAFRALWKIGPATLMSLLPEISRIAMTVPFWWSSQHTAKAWALWQLLGGGVVGLVVIIITSTRLARPKPGSKEIRNNITAGTHFAFGHAAETVCFSVDRVMLGRMSSFSAAGIYSTAVSFIHMATLPIYSLSTAMSPRYFELGLRDFAQIRGFARRNVQAGLGYAMPTSALIFIGAPIIPLLLGSEYAESVSAIRWLALLPVLTVLSDVAGITLSSIDRQGARTRALLLGAVLNVALNVWLIPQYSWKGASVAAILAEAVIGGTLWLTLLSWYTKQTAREAPARS